MKRRGVLTDAIKVKSREMMGREIDTTELRLMPYVMHTMMNSQVLDPNKISSKERAVLAIWRTAGYIEGGASGMGITEEFWNIMTTLVFMGYVDID